MAYKCPYADKRPYFRFIQCKYLQKEGINYDLLENATQAYCAHQRFCKCENGVINSEGAEKCYQYHSTK